MRKIEMKLVEGAFENPLAKQITLPGDIHAIFRSIKDDASETLLAVYLTGDLNGVYDVHSTGCASMTTLSLQDLFGRAYVLRARYLILVHNHPSGDPRPSPADLETLDKINSYLATLPHLALLDFIVIGAEGYWSHHEDAGGGEYSLGAIAA